MSDGAILVVDDSPECRLLLLRMLVNGGYAKLLEADGARAVFQHFGLDQEGRGIPNRNLELDLILLDIVMPELDGIEVCRRLKAFAELQEIPVIMVTADNTDSNLRTVFDLGAVDYIHKPVKQVELCARVKSALRLKREMDRRLALAQELEEANQRLRRMALVDGLTGLANRHCFDEFLDREWRRCQRDGQPLAICLADIDFFKLYNDIYGHLQGDEALKMVAKAFQQVIHRPGDLVARFGGEEFVFILSGSEVDGAQRVVARAIAKIEELAIAHPHSPVAENLTVCFGIAAMLPRPGIYPNLLIECADKALYEAKQTRGNQVVVASPAA